MANSRILCLSDFHCPFEHIDSVKFLKAIKKKYKPDRVICLGDEVTGNAISFHDKDPDGPFSPSSELDAAIEALAPIYKLFPKADVLESNHGSLVYRRAKKHGIPRRYLREYSQILQTPGWKWHKTLTIKMSNGESVFFHHGKSVRPNALSRAVGMSTVQGHYHTKREITWWRGAGGREYFSMIVGCMIDNLAFDFDYNKLNLDDILLGHSVILNGIPKQLPMILNKWGRWNEKLA